MADVTAPPVPIAWLIAHGRELLAHTDIDVQRRLFSKLEPWQVEMLRLQMALRHRSRHRFPHPERWLWTDISLSQASDHWSAKYKAQLFPPGEAVVDACCGAGADLVALAAVGEVVGIDADPTLAALAQDNVQAHGLRANVIVEHVPSKGTSCARWLSIDPDRRATGRRTIEADAFSPPLDQVLDMARSCLGAVIKVAPSTRTDELLAGRIAHQCCRLWLGNQGECRQLLLLTGQLRKPEPRTAVLCEPFAEGGSDAPKVNQNSNVHIYSPGDNPEGSREPTELGPFVFDLHPTLHAADLQCAWATEHELAPVGDVHGYYSGFQPLRSPWAQSFEVLDVLAWDDRKIRKWLRGFGAGQVEVKSRGIYPMKLQLDANECQRRYSKGDGRPLTLLVTRIGNRLCGIAARRLPGSIGECV